MLKILPVSAYIVNSNESFSFLLIQATFLRGFGSIQVSAHIIPDLTAAYASVPQRPTGEVN